MRQFTSNAILLVGLNLGVKGFYLFGIDRTVQNVLPPGEYGLFFTLFNFAFLFQIVADFGLQNYNSRNLAQSRHLLRKYFPSLLLLKGVLTLVYLAGVGGLALLWGYEPALLPLLGLIALNLGLQSLFLFVRSNLAGLGHYRADSLLSVLDKGLMILICGTLLLWAPGFELHWFVLAQTASWLLALLTGLALLRPKLRGLGWRWRPRTLRVLLRRSAPYALVIFLMTAYTRADAIMIEKLLPDGLLQADIYASAFRLLDAANIAGYLLAGLLLPMFARALSRGEEIAPLMRLGLNTLWTGAASLAVATAFFATPIMEALYVTGSPYSGRILSWLMITFVATSGGYVYGSLLTAAGELRQMNRLFVGGLLLNIGLNLWLIPAYAAIGAALATCATQFVILAGQRWLVYRRMGLRPNAGRLLRLLLLPAGVALCCTLLVQPFVPGPWYVKFVLGASAGMLLAFWLRLLDIKQWLPAGKPV